MLFFYIALPLTAPQYTFVQGQFVGDVMNDAVGSNINGRTIHRSLIKVEDGRAWWLSVPADQALAQGSKVKVEVVCTTDQFEQCTARYIGRPKS